MRISSRSRLGLSIIAALGLIVALVGVIAPSGLFAKATPASASDVTFTGTLITGARLASSKGVFTASLAVNSSAATQKPDRVMPSHHAGANSPSMRAASALGRGAPQVASSTLSAQAAEGTTAHNFNGVSSADSFAQNGFQDTPPDQGLCVGFLGGQKVVIELVNSAATIYTTSGSVVAGPVNFAVAFNDPNAFSDPRCFFDTATQSFYLTVISADASGNSVDDVEVINALGSTTYQFPTSFGGACFGDQPHTGYDKHALYVTTDQFCGPGQNTEEGALVIVISKAQLVAQDLSVHAVAFGDPTPLTIGGLPITTLEPAFGGNGDTEYLLNSFPFDQSGNNIASANTLGFWKVTNDASVTNGKGSPVLTGQIISSETYVFPVPAASTGDNSIFCVAGNHPKAPCTPLEPIQREAFLQPDDSRMLQVQLVNDDQNGLQLYAALDSAVTVGSDPTVRDGAAWFVLDPKRGKITSQGYAAVQGAYLLYPAILHTHTGTTAISFTITSTTINPSTAYVMERSTSTSFGSVQITAAGTGQHNSFAGTIFNFPRWGDYSAEELDPNGVDIWSASEYIPPLADQAQRDNWGTDVWDIVGDH